MARLRENTVFADRGLTVMVVESLEFQTSKTSRSRFATGIMKPIQVVVKESDRSYVIDIDSNINDAE